MQKKLIALAVAGLASTAAFAQTNVTIYGIVDYGYAYRFDARGVDSLVNGIVRIRCHRPSCFIFDDGCLCNTERHVAVAHELPVGCAK